MHAEEPCESPTEEKKWHMEPLKKRYADKKGQVRKPVFGSVSTWW